MNFKTQAYLLTDEVTDIFNQYTSGLISVTQFCMALLDHDIHVSTLTTDSAVILCESDVEKADFINNIYPPRFTVKLQLFSNQ